MNTSLSILQRELQLHRYPEEAQLINLQAWDAADEYLFHYMHETYPNLDEQANILILNDDFGGIACWFAKYNLQWISDSYVSKQGCKANFANNNLPTDKLCILDSLTKPNEMLDFVFIKLPKTTALLEHQLIMLQSVVSPDTVIIALGKAKSIQSATLKLFEKHLGSTSTSLAKKKARLIFTKIDRSKSSLSPYPTNWETSTPKFSIKNHANVFSRQQLDIGARLLLQHLPSGAGKTVVDLGCGNGVLGLHMLHQYPDCQMIFVDESYMAVQSAKENVEDNIQNGLTRSHFLHSDCLEQYPSLQREQGVDVVLCNPPFHQQNTITDHIAWQMFKEAKQVLNRGGELRIIGNRHLDYPNKLKRLFGGYKVIASDKKFSILSATKR